MAFGFQFFNRFLDEADKFWIQVAALGHAAFRRPVDDLRAAVGKLRNGDVAGYLPLQSVSEAQFRPEGIVVTGEPQWFPALGNLVSAAEMIFVGDLWVVFE